MTITEEIRDIVERVKNMGPEWRHAAAKCEDAAKAIETARQDRLTFLRDAIARNQERLADIKAEIRTLPEQIAKLEAERERLESQTGLDLLRAVVMGRAPAAVEVAPSDPFVPGLPPLRLREVWAEWEVLERGEPADLLLVFSTDGRLCKWAEGKEWFAVVEGSAIWDGRSMRPHGKTRAEVEAMADARQKPALLDLRELPAGTVCEARDRIQIPYTAVSIRAGVLFTIEEHCKPPIAPGEDVRVRVASTTDTWAIPALVPARVVEEPKGESNAH